MVLVYDWDTAVLRFVFFVQRSILGKFLSRCAPKALSIFFLLWSSAHCANPPGNLKLIVFIGRLESPDLYIYKRIFGIYESGCTSKYVQLPIGISAISCAKWTISCSWLLHSNISSHTIILTGSSSAKPASLSRHIKCIYAKTFIFWRCFCLAVAAKQSQLHIQIQTLSRRIIHTYSSDWLYTCSWYWANRCTGFSVISI